MQVVEINENDIIPARNEKKLFALCQECKKEVELFPILNPQILKLISYHNKNLVINCSCGSKNYNLKIKTFHL